VTPSHQFPTGAIMSMARRRALPTRMRACTCWSGCAACRGNSRATGSARALARARRRHPVRLAGIPVRARPGGSAVQVRGHFAAGDPRGGGAAGALLRRARRGRDDPCPGADRRTFRSAPVTTAPALRRRRPAAASTAAGSPAYSTVTDFARLRGLSTSVPRASAAW
jgi:hypothetical protein